MTGSPGPPALRVDHVSIAVAAIAPALDRLRRVPPLQMRQEPTHGYDAQFRWTDFLVGDFKLELIESAGAGGFVARFLARRGEGFHHLTVDVDDLDRVAARLAREGIALVEPADLGGGRRTAFVHPRDLHGVLLQLWQEADFGGPRRP